MNNSLEVKDKQILCLKLKAVSAGISIQKIISIYCAMLFLIIKFALLKSVQEEKEI